MAFDVAEAAGSVAEVRRLAGDQPFRPAMDGGREAGLYSVNDMEELLLLAVRTAPAITRMAPMAAEDSPREVEIV